MAAKPSPEDLHLRDKKSLLRELSNAERILAKSPDHLEAKKRQASIRSELERRIEPPKNGWTSGVQEQARMWFVDGKHVATVRRHTPHGGGLGGYDVEVLGKHVSSEPYGIDEARALAERIFKEERGGG